MEEYPKREKFYAMRIIRKMVKSAATAEIGPNAFALIATIASTEDAKRYTGPVTYFNDVLQSILGIRKWETLDRARRKAVAAGWLHYVKPPQGSPDAPIYWTLIPDRFDHLDDSPSDDQKVYPKNGDSPQEVYPNNGDAGGDTSGYTPGYTPGYTEGDTGGEPSIPSPKTLFPDPVPKETLGDKSPVVVSPPPKKKAKYPEAFLEFWKAFPPARRKAKPQVFGKWEKALKVLLKDDVCPQQCDAEAFLIKRARDYAESDQGRCEHVRGPEPWLNQQAWEDEPEAWKDKGKTSGSQKTMPTGRGQIHPDDLARNSF